MTNITQIRLPARSVRAFLLGIVIAGLPATAQAQHGGSIQKNCTPATVQPGDTLASGGIPPLLGPSPHRLGVGNVGNLDRAGEELALAAVALDQEDIDMGQGNGQRQPRKPGTRTVYYRRPHEDD